MKTTEGNPELPEKVEVSESAHGRAGFLAGIIFGAFLGAGLALLFAPERGGDMRKRRLKLELERLRERARERARELKESAD